jgi:hypothetical protein
MMNRAFSLSFICRKSLNAARAPKHPLLDSRRWRFTGA